MAKQRKLNTIFIIYWILLAYIIAALVWWYVALNNQNKQMAVYKIQHLNTTSISYTTDIEQLKNQQKRKTFQYLGEGITFFLLILAGAIFIFRAVRKQLRFSKEQQHFMMALTHELKTPIAVATLNLETLQKRKLEEPQQQKLIQNTLQEANRLNTLCNNMLLSSQIDASNYSLTNEDVNLSELVETSIAEYKNRFSSYQFIKNINENNFVIGDRMLLQIAVNNLIDNAIKYSPKESEIIINLFVRNNQTTLQVIDRGKGVSQLDKQKIFDKFYRVGNVATKGAKGTGLGLYLTKNIIGKHKGNISVTDNLPNGSNFEIILPLST
jgi:two-component system, OmpR family, sensor histidine kinase CiaH